MSLHLGHILPFPGQRGSDTLVVPSLLSRLSVTTVIYSWAMAIITNTTNLAGGLPLFLTVMSKVVVALVSPAAPFLGIEMLIPLAHAPLVCSVFIL